MGELLLNRVSFLPLPKSQNHFAIVLGVGVFDESKNVTNELTQIESLTTNFEVGGILSTTFFVVSAMQPMSVIMV